MDQPEGKAVTGRLVARTVPRAQLDAATRAEMWHLLGSHYDGVTREAFERDLAEKEHVILLRDDDDGSLQGFSTLVRMQVRVRGRMVRAVFSGDTIVTPGYWGQRVLQRAFARYLVRVWLEAPLTPLRWFLVSKGYKTYLLLARNFLEYWPRPDRSTPPEARELLEALARLRFEGAYNPQRNVLEVGADAPRLRGGIGQLTPELLSDPHIRFFAHANPRHAEGEELCCLGTVDARLLVHALRKYFLRRAGR